ncbi:uncharacterized protein LOC126298718 [Schistocerca gregaria]|uniref:uncharacterized protein LOC126298718 n=1 Tax=Schistocerca gregaria TaxID=7010 RepID=UPI00211EDF04|nr:uncharacterized protein LOC126298718 [Schistocerca gregaria]
MFSFMAVACLQLALAHMCLIVNDWNFLLMGFESWHNRITLSELVFAIQMLILQYPKPGVILGLAISLITRRGMILKWVVINTIAFMSLAPEVAEALFSGTMIMLAVIYIYGASMILVHPEIIRTPLDE